MKEAVGFTEKQQESFLNVYLLPSVSSSIRSSRKHSKQLKQNHLGLNFQAFQWNWFNVSRSSPYM